jgi:hypothetical protein
MFNYRDCYLTTWNQLSRGQGWGLKEFEIITINAYESTEKYHYERLDKHLKKNI